MKKVSLDIIDSTNTYVLDNSTTLPDLCVVSAKFQSKGKGRMDRVWEGEYGANLLFSMLIKDKSVVSNFASLSLLSAAVVASTIESYGIKGVSIKWPNDVYISGKKVTGILMESKSLEKNRAIALGIGINLNQKHFEGNFTATSISLELGHDIPLEEFKDKIYATLEREVSLLKTGESKYMDYFRSHNYLLKKEVSFIYNNKSLKGVVIGVNDDNTLLVDVNGETLSLFSGEVTFHKGL